MCDVVCWNRTGNQLLLLLVFQLILKELASLVWMTDWFAVQTEERKFQTKEKRWFECFYETVKKTQTTIKCQVKLKQANKKNPRPFFFFFNWMKMLLWFQNYLQIRIWLHKRIFKPMLQHHLNKFSPNRWKQMWQILKVQGYTLDTY